MSNVKFQQTELEILAIYECVTKQETLVYLQESLEVMDEREVEMIAYMKSVARKLSLISDQEFEKLELSTYLHDWEDEPHED